MNNVYNTHTHVHTHNKIEKVAAMIVDYVTISTFHAMFLIL